MSIETSGLMALFSGGETLENLQSTLLQDGAIAEQFAGLLQEQLGMLQQAVEQHSVALTGSESINDLQEFAALFGKELPVVENSVAKEMDETLRTLKEVIVSLSAENPLAEVGVKAEKVNDFLAVEKDSADPLSLEQHKQLALMGETGKLINQPVDTMKSLSELVEEVATELPESLLPHAASKKPEKLSAMEAMEKNVAMLPAKQANGEESELILSETEQADSLFQDAGKKPQQGVAQNALSSVLANDAGLTGGDRSFSAMAADLGMLNRSVSQEARAELVPMSRHFAHPEWGKEFTDKIVWMHRQAVPAAELNLNPRHLGPISIRIDVSQDQASVAFVAQHAVVKEAIEAALPRLREMLGGQELNLVDVDVSQQQSQQRQSDAFGRDTLSEGQQRSMNESTMTESDENDRVETLMEEIENGRAIAAQGILSLFA